ncbi:MAG: Heavy metal transport/detoxification protein [Bacteroidetes bacterium]|jgi:copper chaperone CopZ|nr:Heavy metal transport/detoxification protein [Bacteroidota bacterium]
MKTIKSSLVIAILMVISVAGINAQTDKTAELKIKTSAVCDMCKETLEKNLAFEKGIKKSELDVDSKILTVTYNPQKITPEKIRLAVSKTGYDADDVPANKKAYDKLDGCCKKGAVCNDKK